MRIKTTEPTAETINEPIQPTRLEKNANITLNRRCCERRFHAQRETVPKRSVRSVLVLTVVAGVIVGNVWASVTRGDSARDIRGIGAAQHLSSKLSNDSITQIARNSGQSKGDLFATGRIRPLAEKSPLAVRRLLRPTAQTHPTTNPPITPSAIPAISSTGVWRCRNNRDHATCIARRNAIVPQTAPTRNRIIAP
jgi:hypothetical protein